MPNPSFETGDLTGWKIVSGNAWGSKGVLNYNAWKMKDGTEGIFNKEGTYFALSYENGFAGVGVMQSGGFKVPSGNSSLTFRLGGQQNPLLNVSLHLTDSPNDPVISIFHSTPPALFMREQSIDLTPWAGKSMFISLNDGDINGTLAVDSFVVWSNGDTSNDVVEQKQVPSKMDTNSTSGWIIVPKVRRRMFIYFLSS